MRETAQMEVREIGGREIRIRWKSPRFGEWLAWCYVPASNNLFQDGVGFEVRAATPEEARRALVDKVEAYLAGAAAS